MNRPEETGVELLAAGHGHVDVTTLANRFTIESDEGWELETAAIGRGHEQPD